MKQLERHVTYSVVSTFGEKVICHRSVAKSHSKMQSRVALEQGAQNILCQAFENVYDVEKHDIDCKSLLLKDCAMTWPRHPTALQRQHVYIRDDTVFP